MKTYREKIKYFFLKKNKGLSLTEMLVAVFIFMLIALAAVAIFSSIILMNEKSKKTSAVMEEARTAIETMSKNIRMSSKVKTEAAGKRILMYNNSQEKCIAYTFANGDILRSRELLYPDDEDECSAFDDYSGPSVPMTQANMKGEFFVDETEKESDPKAIGKATIKMEIDGEILQTTVSFRDYEGIVQ